MVDDLKDREEERCKLYGIANTTDSSEIASKLRPIMPHSLRTLQVSDDHFSAENFTERRTNQLLACLTIISNSTKALTSSGLWRNDIESNPNHKKFTPPRGLPRNM